MNKIALIFIVLAIVFYGCSDITTEPEKLIPVAKQPPAGNGSADDPYWITNLENLYWISQNADSWDKHFIQTANINASSTKSWATGEGWEPIGNEQNGFEGVYNGQGYKIDKLYINRPALSFVGLFGSCSGGNAQIKNLELTNVEVTGRDSIGAIAGYVDSLENVSSSGSVAGRYGVGGLAGLAGVVERSFSSAKVTGRDRVGGIVGEGNAIANSFSTGVTIGNNYVGGIVGNGFEMTDCYTTANVIGKDIVGGLAGSIITITNCYSTGNVGGNYTVGGLTGNALSIKNCYSTGNVSGIRFVGGLAGNGTMITESYSTGSVNGDYYIGGLVGHGSSIRDCFSLGNVNGQDKVGGLAGSGTLINHCYSIGQVIGEFNTGGLVGIIVGNQPAIQGFWNFETSGQTESAGGISKTTAEMKSKNTFTDEDWDFDSLWGISGSINQGYPFLLNIRAGGK